MLRSISKRRSSSSSSLVSRTLSSSKLCRGDDVIGSQIDAKALKSIAKKPPKNRVDRITTMQQQMGEMEQFNVNEFEKYRILDQKKLKEAKELAQEANEIKMELESLRKSLDSSRDELRTKDKKIDSLERENTKRIRELEDEFETTKFELGESKIKIISLREKIESLEKEKLSTHENSSKENAVGRLKSELHSSQEAEKNALGEMEVLKNEWRLAIEAEEKSTKAMEDLALALKEVATESNQAKDTLRITQIELEHIRGESEQLKKMVRHTEETYQNLLHEAKQEAELHKNTADRLRLEAEETLLALNGKEMGFVNCIKRAEEERAIAQHENLKLSESLKLTENMTRAAREETYKLRDILKQAVNEANAAKAAAGIARDENSLLKDSILEKDEHLHFLTRENERLRMSEAAANENVKQLKILLSRGSSSSLEFKNGEYIYNELVDDYGKEEQNDENNMNNNNNYMMDKSFSFNLEDLKFMNEPEDKVLDEDPVKAEALRGSIFDVNAETPKSEPRTPKSALSNRQRGYLEDGRVMRKSEDFDHYLDDSDSDKGSHRLAKTMFQRVGDLLTIRRSLHRNKEASSVEHTTVSTHASLN